NQQTVHLSASIFNFFFIDTFPTEIYTLSLHDALPISFLANAGAEFLWIVHRTLHRVPEEVFGLIEFYRSSPGHPASAAPSRPQGDRRGSSENRAEPAPRLHTAPQP